MIVHRMSRVCIYKIIFCQNHAAIEQIYKYISLHIHNVLKQFVPTKQAGEGRKLLFELDKIQRLLGSGEPYLLASRHCRHRQTNFMLDVLNINT